jgi:hypothetical protein
MSWTLLLILFVAGSITFAVGGVWIGRKVLHGKVKEGHNDVMVPLFLTAGVIYAVLLAFMVIAMWETYDAAKANVAEEASLMVPLYRQSYGMDPKNGGEMRHLIREYGEGVIKDWQTFRYTALGSPQARYIANKMVAVFNTMTPASKSREIVTQQFLQTYSQFLLDRNKRLVHAAESLSWIMWAALIGGGMVTIGMTFVLYMEYPPPHYAMASVLALGIGLLLYLMVVLNRPFIGPLGIEPEPYEASLKLFDLIDEDFKKIDVEMKEAEEHKPGAVEHKAASEGAAEHKKTE